MDLQKKIRIRRIRRKNTLKRKYQSWGKKHRVSVFRSSSQIYAQIIDDTLGKTLFSFSSLHLKDKAGDKSQLAKQVGIELGKRALEGNIKDVFFDRGYFLFHGRVKALAEGLRESGLQF